MAVDFKKKIAGKKTKLADKSLEEALAENENPIEPTYIDGNLYKIPLEAIEADPDQPRVIFDEQKLTDLANSIREQGILQPIIVRTGAEEGKFIVVAGERRYRAAKQAELEIVPTLFSEGKPEEIALIENLLRDDLKPIEEAEAYLRIIKKHNYTQKQLCSIVQKTQGTISETLSLTKLPEQIKLELRTSELPKNVLLEISKQKEDAVVKSLFKKATAEGLTVAQIRKLTRPKVPRRRNEIDVRILAKAVELRKLIDRTDQEKLQKMAHTDFFEEIDELILTLEAIRKN